MHGRPKNNPVVLKFPPGNQPGMWSKELIRKLDPFMGLNIDPNRKSNVHANSFLPSCQSWMFDWASKISIVALHGRTTVNRVNVNVFDQAFNECTPFDTNMRNSLLRFFGAIVECRNLHQ